MRFNWRSHVLVNGEIGHVRIGTKFADLRAYRGLWYVGLQMRPANLGIRSLAALIDSIVVSVLWFWVTQTSGTVSTSVDTASLSLTQGKTVSGLPALLLFLATAVYWIVPEWLSSMTLGKLLCGLKVVRLDGKKITFSQSLQRNLLRLVDAFAFYLVGFLVAKLTPLHQRLGDLWAKTLVVNNTQQIASGNIPTGIVNS
jgi:uncharacterized RDD family membrane protein YckC